MATAAAGVLLVASPAVAGADLPAGSFVLDGAVSALSRGGDYTYVGGSFTRQQAPTGAGLVVSSSGSGTPVPGEFPAVVGEINAVVSDGAGGWFVGGSFSRVGGQERSNLAHITAAGALDPSWNPGVDSYGVDALARSGSTLYLGGRFTTVGGQARQRLAAVDTATGATTDWDPHPQGDWVTNVSVLAAAGSTVYVAGEFTTIGGASRFNVAAIAADGHATGWNPQLTGQQDGAPPQVRALAVSGSNVYLGGSFTAVGGAARGSAAAVDAATGAVRPWDAALTIGTAGAVGSVSALAVQGTTVYLGGSFARAGAVARDGLAAVDATSGTATGWAPQLSTAEGSGASVGSLAVDGSTVVVAGGFDHVGEAPRERLAAIDAAGDPTSWNPSPNGPVETVALAGGKAYVGGWFTGAGPTLAALRGLARLNADGSLDTDWAPTPTQGTGTASVGALAATTSTVYLAGQFDQIGGQARSGLAAIDTTSGQATGWNPGPLGDDWYSLVTHLATAGGDVYLAGDFTSVDGVARNNLAAIDTAGHVTRWNPAAAGTPQINDLEVSGSTVYLAGYFDTLGGRVRDGLAAVDPLGRTTDWAPAHDSGINGLAASGSTVYTTGSFTTIGGASRDGLAALDARTGIATSWAPDVVWGPISRGGHDLALGGSDVYVVGSVTAADGATRHGLAAFDATGAATGWSPQLEPDNERFPAAEVEAIAVGADAVALGGDFVGIDDAVTGRLARLPIPAVPLDVTAPVIAVTAPHAGATYTAGAEVTADYACDDRGGSGVESCIGRGVLDTATTGTKAWTITTTDHAGNATAQTITYTVTAPDQRRPGDDRRDDERRGDDNGRDNGGRPAEDGNRTSPPATQTPPDPAQPAGLPPRSSEAGAPRPTPGRAPSIAITVPSRSLALDRRGEAVIASITCPAATICGLRAPRTVVVRVAGKRYVASVRVPRTVRGGTRARMTLRLPAAAIRRLGSRNVTVSFTVRVTVAGTSDQRTVRVRLHGPTQREAGKR